MPSDECGRTSETTRVHVQNEQMRELQEYVNKEKATEIGDEVVTQKKSSELPKRDLEGSEVQDTIEHAVDCVESTISQVIVVESEVVSVRN